VTGPAPAAAALPRRWVLGARPRTLAAAAVPVLVGTASGWWLRRAASAGATGVVGGQPVWWRAGCALVVAVAVQVGTNYANDYSDGVRGTDAGRVGPARLVGSGLASPAAVRRAALLSFAVAGAAGLGLAAAVSWWLVPVGAACFVAGWFYTGGPRPYGYLGLGELFVFSFFGVVATVGSAYVQFPHLGGASYDRLLPLWGSVAVGLAATALLEANNVRDIAGDTVAEKRTLAVRLGRRRAGWLYAVTLGGVAVGIALVAVVRPWALLALVGLVLARRPLRTVLGPAEGKELLPVLGATGRLQLAVGVLLTLGILL
jgi:1,4-dihydroxy-2-naphthoate polyprenyltransferase